MRKQKLCKKNIKDALYDFCSKAFFKRGYTFSLENDCIRFQYCFDNLSVTLFVELLSAQNKRLILKQWKVVASRSCEEETTLHLRLLEVIDEETVYFPSRRRGVL